MYTFTINTRYNQPNNIKGSSITAYLTSGCTNRSMTVAYDYALNTEENHNKVANLLASKLFPDYDTCHPYKETSSKKGYKYSGYIYKEKRENKMKNEIKKLTTKQLIELIETFEHYPAVTLKDGKDYILSYLEDEACTISKKEIAEYLLNNNVKITKENIHLYYEFMSDEEITISSISDKYIKERICDKYGNISNIYYIA